MSENRLTLAFVSGRFNDAEMASARGLLELQATIFILCDPPPGGNLKNQQTPLRTGRNLSVCPIRVNGKPDETIHKRLS